MTRDALTMHLRAWVGAWPPDPAGPKVQVVGAPSRLSATWDGRVRPLQGVGDGEHTVVAVPPEHVVSVRAVIGSDLTDPDLGARLGPILGRPGAVFGTGVFRTTSMPAPIAGIGTWVPTHDGRLPDWLAPFNGPRLVAWDHLGRYVAAVGLKEHDPWGAEIAVVTEPEARGQGLARGLVVRAARRILARGRVPTYLHDPSNVASARVADACGFRDRGWRIHGLWGGE